MLDGIDWAAYETADGRATGLPALFRRFVAAPDPFEAAELLEEISLAVCVRGDVYPAAVPVIRVLARLAAGGPWLRHAAASKIGVIAEFAIELPVLAALRAEVPTMVALLADEDPAVREAAAFAGGRMGVPAARFWERWAVETVSPVRASLLAALALSDPVGAAPVVIEQIVGGPPQVCLSAAAILDEGGTAWPPAAVANVVVAVDAVPAGMRARRHGNPPRRAAATEQGFELVGSGLRSGVRETRLWAFDLAVDLRRRSRAARGPLAGFAAEHVDDPDPVVREQAADLLNSLGPPELPASVVNDDVFAVYRVSGDAAPVRKFVRSALSGRLSWSWTKVGTVLEPLAQLPAAVLRTVAPQARAALADKGREVRLVAAVVVAAVDGIEAALPTIHAVLAEWGGAGPAVAALAPAHRAALAHLEPTLVAHLAGGHLALEVSTGLAALGAPPASYLRHLIDYYVRTGDPRVLDLIEKYRIISAYPLLEPLATRDQPIADLQPWADARAAARITKMISEH